MEAGPNLGGLAGGQLPPSPLPRDCARPGSFSIPDSPGTATRCRATSRRSRENGREALTSLMPTPDEWPRGADQPRADTRRMAERRWPASRARADWRIENDPGPEAPRRTAPRPPRQLRPGPAIGCTKLAELPCWKPPAARAILGESFFELSGTRSGSWCQSLVRWSFTCTRPDAARTGCQRAPSRSPSRGALR